MMSLLKKPQPQSQIQTKIIKLIISKSKKKRYRWSRKKRRNAADYTDKHNTTYQMEQSKDWIKFILEQDMINEPGKKFNYNVYIIKIIMNNNKKNTGIYINIIIFNNYN